MLKTVSKDIEQNLAYLKERLIDCDDIIYRQIEVTNKVKRKLLFVLIDGLAFKDQLSDFVIENLMEKSNTDHEVEIDNLKDEILNQMIKEEIASVEIKEEGNFEELITALLSGETLFFIDGIDRAIIIGSRGWVLRGINEPQTETVIRGPRDGFTETLRTNTALVRRRIKDTNLKIKMKKVGSRSKTDIAILYIADIANENLKNEVERRIDQIDIDAILDSSMLEHLIEDNYKSLFPQMENTERPDSVSASLYEGRVAIIVDNSPFVLIVPATLGTLMQSTEDYYSRWTEATITRFIRMVAVFLALLSPAIYIAITAYHPGLLPTKLVYYVGSSRVNVPFPAVIEATIMEITMELIREAGTRISGPIGSTIGIVGGLIIGQAAVEAGIVSNLMIIIVAITSIATFAIPSYEFGAAIRICKFGFIILAGILGLYGIMLGIILFFSHLCMLNSFDTPLTAPYSGLGIEEGDIKDTLFKAPIQSLWQRPGFTKPKNKNRMKREKKNE